MMFDQFATLAEAAALGFGLALVPDYLAQAETAAAGWCAPFRAAPNNPAAITSSGPRTASRERRCAI